jgi:WD40 repeat protein
MIELFAINPPWNVPPHCKFVAHDDSIIDICYLSKA